MPATMPPALDAARFVELGQPTLSAGDLTLVPLGREHTSLLVTAYADDAIVRWHGRSLDEDEARTMAESNAVEWATGIRANWAVGDRDGPQARVGLNHLDLFAGEAELAYWCLATARGRSIVPRALGVLVPWLFDELGLQRLTVVHSVRNEASCRVATKAGFALEGVMRGQLRHLDGWHDSHLHARLAGDPRPQWEASREP